MRRYREPAVLRSRRSPRVLLALDSTDSDLDEPVRAARSMYPDAMLIVALTSEDEVDFGRFQRLMNHPDVDVAVLGTPDLEELTTSWRVDNLLLRDRSGVICETTRRSSS